VSGGGCPSPHGPNGPAEWGCSGGNRAERGKGRVGRAQGAFSRRRGRLWSPGPLRNGGAAGPWASLIKADSRREGDAARADLSDVFGSVVGHVRRARQASGRINLRRSTRRCAAGLLKELAVRRPCAVGCERGFVRLRGLSPVWLLACTPVSPMRAQGLGAWLAAAHRGHRPGLPEGKHGHRTVKRMAQMLAVVGRVAQRGYVASPRSGQDRGRPGRACAR